MDEPEGLSILDDANAIEAKAVFLPPMVRAVKIIRPVGRHKESVATNRKAPPEIVKIAHAAENIAANRGRVQQAEKNLGIKIIGLAEGLVERRIGGARPGKGGSDLARGQPYPSHRTVGEELVPGF